MPSFDHICDGIFIGNAYSVIGNYRTKESDVLNENKITVVISALTEEEYEDYYIAQEDFPGIAWYRFVIDDEPKENIQQHFFTVHRIIRSALEENKRVIVHCAAGYSRSPTLVIAYLMIENKWTAEEAIAFVKTKRDVEPNKGFQRQLQGLEYKVKNLQHLFG